MNVKLLCCLMTLLLCLGLCACGQEAAPAPTETPTATETPAPTETPEPVETSSAPAQRQSVLPGAGLHAAEEAEVDETAALIADAQRFVDGPLDALLEALGEPLSRDYAPSCLGPGQDGELRYEGFTVYTYQSEDGETVTGVE